MSALCGSVLSVDMYVHDESLILSKDVIFMLGVFLTWGVYALKVSVIHPKLAMIL